MRTKATRVVDARMVSVELLDVIEDDAMPVWRFGNPHSTGTLLPERVEMRWENGQLVRLAVYGRRIKNAGGVGNGASSTQFVQHGDVHLYNVRPPWLTDLLVEHRP